MLLSRSTFNHKLKHLFLDDLVISEEIGGVWNDDDVKIGDTNSEYDTLGGASINVCESDFSSWAKLS